MTVKTPDCPLCGQPPLYTLDRGHQCFCGNEDCLTVTWDSHVDLDTLLTNYHGTIDLSGLEGPDDH